MFKPFRALDPFVEDTVFADQESIAFLEQMETLVSHQIEPPFCLSLNGTWGSGKTSLMKELYDRLETKDYPVLWFNPWEYERVEDVVLCFLAGLAEKAKRDWKIPVKDLGVFGLSLFAGSVDAFARFATKNAVSFKNFQDIHAEVEKALASRGSRYEDPVKVMRDDFVSLTQKIVASNKHGTYPLVVFIDDLDRCLPDKALEMLEALKNLFVFKDARVIFVAGIDTDVAKRFIIQRYPNMDLGYAANYFRKIFHATLNVPLLEKDPLKALIEKRVAEFWRDEEPVRGKATLIRQLADGLEQYRVRSLRQCHSVVQSYYLWCKFHGGGEPAVVHHMAVEFLFLREKDPDLVQALSDRMRPESGETKVSNFLSNNRNDPELERLKQYKGWLEPDDETWVAQQKTQIQWLRWL